MKWIRGVIAVVVGYVVAQGLNSLLVYYWYIGDGAPGGWLGPVLTVVLFVLFGLAAGHLAGIIAREQHAAVGIMLATLIVVVTVGNIVADVAAEPLWHKVLAIAVLAPAALVGAWARLPGGRRGPPTDSAAA